MNTCVAIVSARGGSKGIPGKNIRQVGGKPLIAWTLTAARQCTALERIIVSTDSDEIAAAAPAHGGEIPFMRPAELAQDNTPGKDPVLHAVRWLEIHEHYKPDLVMLLQPTSPLRTVEDINQALHVLAEKAADAVVSVTLVDSHPYWMKRLDFSGRLTDFIQQDTPVDRRQDLPPLYALNGAVYLIRREILLEQETLFPANTWPLVMPRERSLDVDTPWELYLADLILKDREHRELH